MSIVIEKERLLEFFDIAEANIDAIEQNINGADSTLRDAINNVERRLRHERGIKMLHDNPHLRNRNDQPEMFGVLEHEEMFSSCLHFRANGHLNYINMMRRALKLADYHSPVVVEDASATSLSMLVDATDLHLRVPAFVAMMEDRILQAQLINEMDRQNDAVSIREPDRAAIDADLPLPMRPRVTAPTRPVPPTPTYDGPVFIDELNPWRRG